MGDGFGIANLPYGSVQRDAGAEPCLCVRLGDDAIELAALDAELGVERELVAAPNLDRLLAADPDRWAALRRELQRCLAGAVPPAARIPLDRSITRLPFTVNDYVDFYASLEHASNLGRMFRPDAEALAPNWRHVPIGYHGRASTVVVSGTPIRRPQGQRLVDAGPVFGPTESLDIELELAFLTGGTPNRLGDALGMAEAERRIFGIVLLNDWSARDVQRWEYVPLGPFLGKSFATSISAWVVPLAALEPARVAPREQVPPPLGYLRTGPTWALDIDLEIELGGQVISTTNASGLYWSAPQLLTHAASNGAIIRPGDLFASGTISGTRPGSEGSLIELTGNGRRPLSISGQSCVFLADGDRVVLRGRAGDVALGEVSGEILPACDADRDYLVY